MKINLKEIEEREQKATEMISSLCKPRGMEGTREWIMSIPARPDYDPDLIIGRSLTDILALTNALREACELLEETRYIHADANCSFSRIESFLSEIER